MIEVTVPIFHEGKPANLQAAIIDAMYWLRWLRSQLNDAPADAQMKRTVSVGLRSAIQALTEFLPYEPQGETEAPGDD